MHKYYNSSLVLVYNIINTWNKSDNLYSRYIVHRFDIKLDKSYTYKYEQMKMRKEVQACNNYIWIIMF